MILSLQKERDLSYCFTVGRIPEMMQCKIAKPLTLRIGPPGVGKSSTGKSEVYTASSSQINRYQ